LTGTITKEATLDFDANSNTSTLTAATQGLNSGAEEAMVLSRRGAPELTRKKRDQEKAWRINERKKFAAATIHAMLEIVDEDSDDASDTESSSNCNYGHALDFQELGKCSHRAQAKQQGKIAHTKKTHKKKKAYKWEYKKKVHQQILAQKVW
jgi:hypothetical protein